MAKTENSHPWPAHDGMRAGPSSATFVNMAVALECQADVYLVAEIDRLGCRD
jgi:cobyric acid synthase